MCSGRVADFARDCAQPVSITRDEDHAGAFPRTGKHQIAAQSGADSGNDDHAAGKKRHE
jgi:hypothetical protein